MKSLVWSVFLYGAENLTIKRSDRDRINSLGGAGKVADEECCQAEVTVFRKRGEGKRR